VSGSVALEAERAGTRIFCQLLNFLLTTNHRATFCQHKEIAKSLNTSLRPAPSTLLTIKHVPPSFKPKYATTPLYYTSQNDVVLKRIDPRLPPDHLGNLQRLWSPNPPHQRRAHLRSLFGRRIRANMEGRAPIPSRDQQAACKPECLRRLPGPSPPRGVLRQRARAHDAFTAPAKTSLERPER
jgi:hypothetical protein